MARTNVLLKCFHSHDSQLQVKLFNACVRPILEYNSPIRSPHLSKDVASIKRVQQYFTKNLRGLKNKTYSQRLATLGLMLLQIRRIRADLIYLFKIQRNLVDPQLKLLFTQRTATHHTRSHDAQLHSPIPRTDLLKYSFVYRSIHMWNKLPSNIVNCASLPVFKQLITDYINVHDLSYVF